MVMGMVKGQDNLISPLSSGFASFSFHIKQTNKLGDRAILEFDLEKSEVKVMGEVKG